MAFCADLIGLELTLVCCFCRDSPLDDGSELKITTRYFSAVRNSSVLMCGFRTQAKAAGVVAHLRRTHHPYQKPTYAKNSSEPISADPANFLAINLRFLLFLLTRGKMCKVVEISCCIHVLTYEGAEF